MEVIDNQGAHLTLLSSAFDPYLFVLASYLVTVVGLLVWLTRTAIVDDLVSIAQKPRAVKRILARTGLSLAATWYYMIKYMFWSYSAYLERINLTGGEITSLPTCTTGLSCMEKIAAAKLLRVSSWLRETSLFQEAWLHVVGGKVNWWWSVEICTFTVGVMALQFRQKEKDKTIPHLWAYMLLGQSVAISVAWNLVEAATEMRDCLRATSELLALYPPDAEPYSFKKSSDDEAAPSDEISDDEGLPEESSDESSSSSEESSDDESAHPSKPSNLRKAVWTDYTIHTMPRYGDLLFSLAMVLAGLVSVYRTPASIIPILFMHLCPLLLLLPIPLPTTPVSERWRGILSTSSLYFIIAAFSVLIRLESHWDAWPHIGRLLPAFTSHPAQSSISADAVCLAISVMDSMFQGSRSRRGSPWMLSLLVPVLGPSAVLAIHYALEHKHRQQWEKNVWEIMDKDEQYQHKDMFIREEFVTTYRSINDIAEEGEGKKTK